MDSPNVALHPLLDHIAEIAAVSFVEQMEEILPSDAPGEEGGK